MKRQKIDKKPQQLDTLYKDAFNCIIGYLNLIDALALSQVSGTLREKVYNYVQLHLRHTAEPVLKPSFAVTLDCKARLFYRSKSHSKHTKIPDGENLTILNAEEVYKFFRAFDHLSLWMKLYVSLNGQSLPKQEINSNPEIETKFSKWFETNLRPLQALQELQLARLSIAWIPTNFGKLKSLRKLDLSRNAFFKVPVEISELKELMSLNLSYNRIQSLPNWLENLNELEIVIITGNPLSPKFLGLLSEHIQLLHYNGTGEEEIILEVDDLKQLSTATANYVINNDLS